MRKIKDLKVGDTVVVYQENSRYDPVEKIVEKVGRTKLHVKHSNYSQIQKFSIEYGSSDYGFCVFPGNMEEYKVFVEEKELTRKFRQEFGTMYRLHLTADQIDRIKKILNE
jgi:hypothetical protein